MRSNWRQTKLSDGALVALIVTLWGASAAAWGQPPLAAEPESARAPTLSLSERQRMIRDRVQLLESRMLELSRLLAESEPAKAERLRDGLRFAGSRRIKTRLERLTQLLAAEQLSEADRQQELLLKDLNALLALLTSSLNEVERRRAERQRLEAFKRTIRTLIDDQLQILYRTQHVAQRRPSLEARSQDTATTSEVAEMLRQLERLQRTAQRAASELQRDMRGSDEPSRPAPGTPQVEQAAQQMQQAADRLGERQPTVARENQQRALEQLQRALDELADALRQVRREETEETLATLEARLRSMLKRENHVLETVTELHEKDAADWTRLDQLRLAESARMQREVHEDCQATLRILLDEGTTVIVPELIRQVATDMADVAARLEQDDTSAPTQRALSDIIALLEEVLEAVEKKRDADARQTQEGQPPDDQPRPLLPGSAELKLLRSAQLRLNQRTLELSSATDTPDEEQVQALERLAARQRHLAELARQMNERE